VIRCHAGFKTGVSILSGVTWTTVKKMDEIQTEVSTGFFLLKIGTIRYTF